MGANGRGEACFDRCIGNLTPPAAPLPTFHWTAQAHDQFYDTTQIEYSLRSLRLHARESNLTHLVSNPPFFAPSRCRCPPRQRFEKGDEVLYVQGDDPPLHGIVKTVHLEGETPYYTVLINETGREKNTDHFHLRHKGAKVKAMDGVASGSSCCCPP